MLCSIWPGPVVGVKKGYCSMGVVLLWLPLGWCSSGRDLLG